MMTPADLAMEDLHHFRDNCIEVGNPVLFKSQQAAHDAMMSVVCEVLAELKAAGVKFPSDRRFVADMVELGNLYRLFAPADPTPSPGH